MFRFTNCLDFTISHFITFSVPTDDVEVNQLADQRIWQYGSRNNQGKTNFCIVLWFLTDSKGREQRWIGFPFLMRLCPCSWWILLQLYRIEWNQSDHFLWMRVMKGFKPKDVRDSLWASFYNVIVTLTHLEWMDSIYFQWINLLQSLVFSLPLNYRTRLHNQTKSKSPIRLTFVATFKNRNDYYLDAAPVWFRLKDTHASKLFNMIVIEKPLRRIWYSTLCFSLR